MVASKGSNDDRDLVGRARRGDREAFTQLIMQYQVPLDNMALRMVGRPDDAADIAQEAFLRAWEKIRTLREAPFKSWLFQIAANLCYDHFRRGRRYGVMPEDDQTSTSNVVGLGIATPDPQERAEANERTRLVRDSIAALDHDMRIAIVLRDVNGMAYNEIAAVLRVPLGTVKSRIARARAQVQECLQQHPDFFPTREDACAECTRRLEGLRETVHAVRALPMDTPTRTFTIPAQRRQSFRWAPVGWVGGVAAAFLVVALGVTQLHGPAGSTASTSGGFSEHRAVAPAASQGQILDSSRSGAASQAFNPILNTVTVT